MVSLEVMLWLYRANSISVRIVSLQLLFTAQTHSRFFFIFCFVLRENCAATIMSRDTCLQNSTESQP